VHLRKGVKQRTFTQFRKEGNSYKWKTKVKSEESKLEKENKKPSFLGGLPLGIFISTGPVVSTDSQGSLVGGGGEAALAWKVFQCFALVPWHVGGIGKSQGS